MTELEQLRAGIRAIVERCMATHPIVWEIRRVHAPGARGGHADQVEQRPSAMVLQPQTCPRCQQLLALLGQ